MAAGGRTEGEVYHRRLDRTPDTLSHLPEEDRRLISKLRGALHGTHGKISSLRDEVDEKEQIAERESTLRKKAEQNLESHLVSMYADKSVDEELRERLPRARKTKDISLNRQKTGSDKEDSGRKPKKADEESVSDGDTGDRRRSNKGKGSPNGHRSHHRRRHHRNSDATVSDDESYSLEGSHSPRRRHRHDGNLSQTFPGFASIPPGGFYPAMPYTPPQMFYAVPAMQGASPGVMMAPPAAQSTPTHNAQIPTMQPNTPVQNTGESINVPVSDGQTGLGVRRHSDPNAPTAQETLQLPHKHLTILGNVSVDKSVDDTQQRYVDQSRQISLLLSELDSARDLNKKLSEKLAAAEAEIESLKMAIKMKDSKSEAELSARAAALVDEIYHAQKERDTAVMNRLRLANEERDEALLRLKSHEGAVTDMEMSEGEDVSLNQLLARISGSESPTQIKKHGGQILDRIKGTKIRRKEITSEEMNAILEERDALMAKCKRLEEELLKLQRKSSRSTPEHEQQRQFKSKLLATQQERDMALAKVRKMEEEMQNIRVYYSLHKSLSQEQNMKDQFNNTLDNIEHQFKMRENEYTKAQKDNNHLLARLKDEISEKEHLKAELNKAKAGQKESEENNQKLERLVNVLRRKINGLGTKSDD